jgi:hypothetical protein
MARARARTWAGVRRVHLRGAVSVASRSSFWQ